MKKTKNNIYTQGYFLKRLRDCGFIVLKMYNEFAEHDPRRWTVLVDPGNTSIFITCSNDQFDNKEVVFSFDDGGRSFGVNHKLKTSSMEVLVEVLMKHGAQQLGDNSKFIKDRSETIIPN